MSRRPARLYVGNLPPDIRVSDIKELFDSRKYGKILDVDLKNEKGPPFAFVEFENQDDADYAVEKRHGYDYDGYKLRVEYPRGSGGDSRSRFGSSFSRDRGGGGRGRGSFEPRSSKYRVSVSGLPKSGSWQDLKDHMREAGDVLFTDVFRNGTGICEFKTSDAMRYAIDKLHDSKFTSHENETSYITVKSDDRGRSRSRSRSRRRSRSRSRDRRRDRSRSKSRSRSRSRRSRSGSVRARTRSRTGSR
ncbi:serine/arginine-rich splicing factor 1A-like [Convolutriloba macropyga]|uniref:serine/arginine-rich splicing factor 1A-like n=1 Tax=Convolutriloba macropyga TaxID=536237 RepID=UPI003F524E76